MAQQSITLQTSDADVISGDIIGRVNFAASNESSGSEAKWIGASVYAEASGEFTATVNPTNLVFATSDADGIVARHRVTNVGHFVPLLNTTYNLGASASKYNNIFAATGTLDRVATTGIQLTGSASQSGLLYINNSNLISSSPNVLFSNADLASPKLIFKASGTTTPDLSLNILTTASGTSSGVQTLSVQGSAGELFSITDVLDSGTIFSVNDISGLSLIEADASGVVTLVRYGTNVAVGDFAPTQKLHVGGNLRVSGAIYDSLNSPGTSGQVLVSTAVGTDWKTLSEIVGVDGVGTSGYLARWIDAETISSGIIYDNGTNIGIGTASPTQTLDIRGNALVSGQLIVPTGSAVNPSILCQSDIANQGVNANVRGIYFDTTSTNQGVLFKTSYSTVPVAMFNQAGLRMGRDAGINWVGAGGDMGVTASDLGIFRDAANTLGQSNGANAQAYNIYNTRTDANNYERAKIAWSSNVLQIGTEQLGTGAARSLAIQTSGVPRLTISATAAQVNFGGHISPPAIYTHSGSSISAAASGAGITIYRVAGAADNEIGVGFYSNASTLTAGFWYLTELQQNFAPTSGTGIYVAQRLNITVNQTGGANGISRGIWVNPTLTAAADWRSIETSNNTGFAVYTAGTAVSYFGGNVGVGQTSPTATLHVQNSSTTATGVIVRGAAAQTADLLQIQNSAGTTLLDIDAAGSLSGVGSGIFMQRLGVGTSAPVSMLHVVSPTGGYVANFANGNISIGGKTEMSAASPQVVFVNNASVANRYWVMGTNSASDTFEIRASDNGSYTAGTNAIAITQSGALILKTVFPSGDIGIGTTSPTQRLHVSGNMRLTGALFDSLNLPGASGQVLVSTSGGVEWRTSSGGSIDGTGSANYLARWIDADTLGTGIIYDDGINVGIGTTTSSYKLSVNGSGEFTNGLYAKNIEMPYIMAVGRNLTNNLDLYAIDAVDNIFGLTDTDANGSGVVLIGDRAGVFSSGVKSTVAIGNVALASGTNAPQSVFIGRRAGQNTDSLIISVAVGAQAMLNAKTSSVGNDIGYTTAIGYAAGSNSKPSGRGSSFIGAIAGANAVETAFSTFIGYGAGYYSSGVSNCTAIGRNSFSNLSASYVDAPSNSAHSVVVGNYSALYAKHFNYSTAIGFNAASSSSGNYNTYIGPYSGGSASGNYNIELLSSGFSLLSNNSSASNKLHIGRLIGGDFESKKLSIGNVTAFTNLSPNATLEIIPKSTTDVGVIIQGTVSQTEDFQQWKNSAGTILTRIDAAGSISGVASGIFGENLRVANIPSGTTETNVVMVKTDGTFVKRLSSSIGVSVEDSIINALIFG